MNTLYLRFAKPAAAAALSLAALAATFMPTLATAVWSAPAPVVVEIGTAPGIEFAALPSPYFA